jgi:transglutaminase-like putative cysteine protease
MLQRSKGSRVFQLTLLSAAAAFLFRTVLSSDLSIILLVLLSAPVTALSYTRKRSPAHLSQGIRILSFLYPFMCGVFILVAILITPYSSYVQWFESFRNGQAAGVVSNIFVLVAAFLSALIIPNIPRLKVYATMLLFLLMTAFIFAVILQTIILFLITISIFFLLLLYINYVKSPNSAGAAVFVLTALLLSTSVLVSALLKTELGPEGNQFVNTRLSPALRKTVVKVLPQFPLLYADKNYGLAFDEKKLGGVPVLSQEKIFRLKGSPGESVYLRTSIYDYYNGKSWTKSRSVETLEKDRYGSFFVPQGRANEENLGVQILTNRYELIPFTLDTETIFFPESVPKVKKGNLLSGFILEEPFSRHDSFVLHRGTPPVQSLDNQLRLVYTQIPYDLPVQLRTIAEDLGRGHTGRREILKNIESFLAYNYSYDLSAPGIPIEEEDFVYSFLFSASSGYCVHFATSFIILSRLNGIPARYATGYLSHIPSDSETVDVTGLSSHAWPEVWIDGKGWTTWEATTAVNLDYYEYLEGDWLYQFGIDLNRNTSRQIEGIMGRSVTVQPEDPGIPVQRQSESGERDGIIFFAIGGLALLAVAAIFIAPSLLFPVLPEKKKQIFLIKKIMKRAGRCGVPSPEYIGWFEWCRIVKEKCDVSTTLFDDNVMEIVQGLYEDENPRSIVVPLKELSKSF